MTDEDIKKIERAARDSHTLSENLKSLDFELQQFNQFAHKVKTIRTKGILLGIFLGMLSGVMITVFATKPILNMYVNSQTANLEKIFYEALPFQYYADKNKVQLWAPNSKSKIWAADGGLNVIEFDLKK